MGLSVAALLRSLYLISGNHERDWPFTGDRFLQENAKDSGGECGVVAEKRVPMPIPHPGQQWYTSLVFLH